MTTIQVSAELVAWLARKGMGAGTQVEGSHVPATAQRVEGETRADLNSGKGPGKLIPGQVHKGGNSISARETTRLAAKEPSPAGEGRPVLKLVCSNKDVRRHNPTSKAPLGLRTSLVLVKGGAHD